MKLLFSHPSQEGELSKISVQLEDFDGTQESRLLTQGNNDIGGVVSFIGLVRDSKDKNLKSLTLEHYPAMTEMELERIASEAEARWPLCGLTIIHRYGELMVGDQIVLVIAASAHRDAAFNAASYIMDFLKTRAPFWKKEDTGDGGTWVDAKESDDTATDKWSG